MLNAIFAGTPELAAQIFQNILHTKSVNIIACLTQADKPTGRGRKMTASPVKQIALAHNIPVHQPITLKEKSVQDLITNLSPDVVIVVAYGLIIPQNLLVIPKHGWLNVHMSLLPRWRGATPMQQVILHGDKATGITIMQMNAALDAGDILAIDEFAITDQDTCASLHDKMVLVGTTELLRVLAQIESNTLKPRQQDESQACYAPKINKQDGKINWSQPALQICRQVRAFNPTPVAFTQIGETIVRIWQAETAQTPPAKETPGTILAATKQGIEVATIDGSVNLQVLQLPGKKPVTAAELINSKHASLAIGNILQ